MFYFFYGDDTDKRREKIGKLIKTKNAALCELKEEELSIDFLEEMATSQVLFDEAQIFLLRDLLLSKELKEILKKCASLMAQSANAFIVSQASATKDLLSAIEKKGAELVECSLKEKPIKKDGGNFALGDAIGRRDRKAAWVLYQEAMSKGAVSEELHGIIFWVMKNIFLAKVGGATGLSPYPLMKAKSFESKWSNGEVRGALSRLVGMYHDSHRGIVEFPVALEMFLLETV
ncbi:MAG: hypothetical protein AAB507_02300 [Patescibacteria group bacterium]